MYKEDVLPNYLLGVNFVYQKKKDFGGAGI